MSNTNHQDAKPSAELAKEIINNIEEAIAQCFAVFDGADQRYYQKFFENFKKEQEELAQICGLPIDVIQQIAAAVDKEKAIKIAKELVEKRFKYAWQNKGQQQEVSKQWQKDESKKHKRDSDKSKDLDQKDDLQEQEEQEEQELNSAKTLAKLAEKKQRAHGQKVLKKLLFSMIAARMDPKQRAGETAKSNVKNAQNFGRGHMLGLAMLLKAGLITGKVMDSMVSKGFNGKSLISLEAVRSGVHAGRDGIFNLIESGGQRHGHMTNIPSLGDASSVFSKIDKSMGIFGPKAEKLSTSNQIKADSTPFVQSVKEQGRGI